MPEPGRMLSRRECDSNGIKGSLPEGRSHRAAKHPVPDGRERVLSFRMRTPGNGYLAAAPLAEGAAAVEAVGVAEVACCDAGAGVEVD